MIIPEMQELKKKFPQLEEQDDSALLVKAAQKYPKKYKDLLPKYFGSIRKPNVIEETVLGVQSPSIRKQVFEDAKAAVPALQADSVYKRLEGSVRAIAAGRNPIEGFKDPEKQPQYIDSVIQSKFADNIGVKSEVFPTSAAIINGSVATLLDFFVPAILYGSVSKAAAKSVPVIEGAVAKGKDIYSSIQGNQINELKSVLLKEFVGSGFSPKAVKQAVDTMVYKQFMQNDFLKNNPIAIRQSINALKQNPGMVKDYVIDELSNVASSNFIKTASQPRQGYNLDKLKSNLLPQKSFIADPSVGEFTPIPTPKLKTPNRKYVVGYDTVNDRYVLAPKRDLATGQAGIMYSQGKIGPYEPGDIAPPPQSVETSVSEKGKSFGQTIREVKRDARVKHYAKKSLTKEEYDQLDPDLQKRVIEEKLKKAKNKRYIDSIKRKYGITEPEVPPIEPYKAQTPAAPKETLFNANDRDSVVFNRKIDQQLANSQADAANRELLNPKQQAFRLNPYIDTTYAFQGIEERTGFPMYTKYYTRGNTLANEMNYEIEKQLSAVHEGTFTKVQNERILNWIVSRNVKLTPKEQDFANKVVRIFKDATPKVKYLRMRNWIAGIGDIPPRHKALVEVAKKIYETRGPKALEAFVKDKDFGVIQGGTYVPSNFKKAFNVIERQDPFDLKNPYLEPRTSPNPTYDTDTSLVRKLNNYLTRVYGDYYFKDFIAELKDDIASYKLSPDAYNGIRSWVGALQGQPIQVGDLARIGRKVRGQFFNVVLADPKKWVRNTFQNFVTLYPRYPVSTVAYKQANWFKTKLSPEDLDYYRKFVSQRSEISREFLFLEDEPILASRLFKAVNDLSRKGAGVFTLTDEIQRYWAYKFAMTGLRENLQAYKSGTLKLTDLLKREGMGTFTKLELKRIFSLPIEDARREIAKLTVEKTSFRYRKHERGIYALSELGEFAGSLVQFPKDFMSGLIDAINTIKSAPTFDQKWQGASQIIGTAVMASVAGTVLTKITGITKYFDPVAKREIVDNPYDILKIITGTGIGGAQLAHVVMLQDSLKLTGELMYELMQPGHGNKKRVLNLTRSLLKNADQIAESYIPFLKKGMDLLEALPLREGGEGSKYIKLLTTSFDHITNRRTATKSNHIKRTLIEGISHVLFGTERK